MSYSANYSSTTNSTSVQSIRKLAIPAFAFVAVLWCIKLLEVQLDLSLHFLGVFPTALQGITGIFTAPLIHGSFDHLVSNSLPLLVLMTALFYGYPNSKYRAFVIIWLGSGLGTWLFAREAWHFGASGLTHGLFFFLLLASILRRDKRSFALMMVAFFMYGGMLMSIFPQQENISFEYHLFGAISGLLAAVLFRNADPKLKEKTYSWENDDDDNENNSNKLEEQSDDDLIGDDWRPDNISLASQEYGTGSEELSIKSTNAIVTTKERQNLSSERQDKY